MSLLLAITLIFTVPSAFLVAAMVFLEWRDRRHDRRVARELDAWLMGERCSRSAEDSVKMGRGRRR